MAETFFFLMIAVALGVMLGIGGACLLADLYARVRHGTVGDDTAFERVRRVFGPGNDHRV